ncbi:QcrA and Rieske domain-containing protein [Occallatibacter riparius]|uniref:Rieske (2Fe-2S) protein n=1 Tax=Occallatibacter riparius TaxID=1002689 RepID=A0A9J7BW11_9BACT|nr:Rieske (2Fe-2S) protein [Occallatibacter riparius]UWZ85078.1 Rieske (2Fe-2S) protein [Occallatibacter riparius]
MSGHIVLEPIQTAPEAGGDKATRRGFLIAAGAAGLCYVGALGYPVYRYLASPIEMASSASAVTEVTLKDAQKLAPGSVLMFKFGSAPAMLIHHQDGAWVALTAVCTHLGCTVQYESQMNRIHCACHGGVYDPRTGANVSGPPPKPLKLFKVAVNETGVLVSRA